MAPHQLSIYRNEHQDFDTAGAQTGEAPKPYDLTTEPFAPPASTTWRTGRRAIGRFGTSGGTVPRGRRSEDHADRVDQTAATVVDPRGGIAPHSAQLMALG
jgi:hypothetical protein